MRPNTSGAALDAAVGGGKYCRSRPCGHLTLGHSSAGVAWSCMPALASTSFCAMPCMLLLAACKQYSGEPYPGKHKHAAIVSSRTAWSAFSAA